MIPAEKRDGIQMSAGREAIGRDWTDQSARLQIHRETGRLPSGTLLTTMRLSQSSYTLLGTSAQSLLFCCLQSSWATLSDVSTTPEVVPLYFITTKHWFLGSTCRPLASGLREHTGVIELRNCAAYNTSCGNCCAKKGHIKLESTSP